MLYSLYQITGVKLVIAELQLVVFVFEWSEDTF